MTTIEHATVTSIRHALLELHKQLLDAAREQHERVHGRVAPADFLRLLIESPELAWLGALTALIVRADEWLEDDERAPADGDAWVAELSVLLRPEPGGAPFQHHYAAALQDRPAVVMAHGTVMRLARAAAPPRPPTDG
jgi:hypothetical protein